MGSYTGTLRGAIQGYCGEPYRDTVGSYTRTLRGATQGNYKGSYSGILRGALGRHWEDTGKHGIRILKKHCRSSVFSVSFRNSYIYIVQKTRKTGRILMCLEKHIIYNTENGYKNQHRAQNYIVKNTNFKKSNDYSK